MINFCPQCATPVQQQMFEGKARPTCPACGYIAFADPKVAATVLIERDNKILFIRRAIDPGRGRWCFPGGYVDFGEDPTAAAMRECREETGLEVTVLTLLDLAFDGRVIVITYLAQVAEGVEPVAADDADLVAWFGLDELPPLAFNSMTRPIQYWQNQATRSERQH